MFNPKITDGQWRWQLNSDDYSKKNDAWDETWVGRLVAGGKDVVCDFGDNKEYYPECGEAPDPDDCKAIAAVPELLEVYHRAKEYMDYHYLSLLLHCSENTELREKDNDNSKGFRPSPSKKERIMLAHANLLNEAIKKLERRHD